MAALFPAALQLCQCHVIHRTTPCSAIKSQGEEEEPMVAPPCVPEQPQLWHIWVFKGPDFRMKDTATRLSIFWHIFSILSCQITCKFKKHAEERFFSPLTVNLPVTTVTVQNILYVQKYLQLLNRWEHLKIRLQLFYALAWRPWKPMTNFKHQSSHKLVSIQFLNCWKSYPSSHNTRVLKNAF